MLVLDSNTISYYFRGDPAVVPQLQALRPAELGVPAIVEYELRYGLQRLPPEASAPRLAALAQLLRPCNCCLLTVNAPLLLPACVRNWKPQVLPLAHTTP